MQKVICKQKKIISIVTLSALVFYNVLYFVIPFNRNLSNGAFWVTYGFTTFFFILATFIAFLGVKDRELKLRVFGIPLVKLAIATCIVEFLFDVIVMILGSFFIFPTWIVVLIESIITLYVFISVIFRYLLKEHIKEVDSHKSYTSFIKQIRIELKNINIEYSSHELANDINELYETVKYTDPVSNKEVGAIEDQILSNIETLKTLLKLGELDSSKKMIFNIKNLIIERATIVKNSH